MKTLFIDRKSSCIEVDAHRLQVRIAGESRPSCSIPTRMLDTIVISCSVTLSSTVLTNLTAAGVSVVIINPGKYEASTMTMGLMHNDATRRLLQYRAVCNDELRINFIKILLTGKCRQQGVMLTRALKKRPDQRYALTKGVERIKTILEQIPRQHLVDSLRGLEGAAASAYFEAYRSLFPESLAFNARNRRPPKDPVNAVLSLTYTLLHAEAVKAAFATGFDPLLGFYHEPSFGRESLACDLVELFRASADQWVWRLFAEQTLIKDHFDWQEGGEKPCLLGKTGRAAYYFEYAIKVEGWRRMMRRVCKQGLDQLRLTCGDYHG